MARPRKLPLPIHLAGCKLSYLTGHRPALPFNLTVSVTYACPSRCLTCGIWQKKARNLSVDEYARIFPSFEKVPIWVTISGGDQFLRGDLDAIVERIAKDIEPKIINIPMNGIATGRIFSLLPRIAEVSRASQLVLNLSVDEVGEACEIKACNPVRSGTCKRWTMVNSGSPNRPCISSTERKRSSRESSKITRIKAVTIAPSSVNNAVSIHRGETCFLLITGSSITVTRTS